MVNLPYNPLLNIHYQKVNIITSGSLIVYVKGKPLSDDFFLEKDENLFKDYLNPNELSLAFRGNEKILIPKVSDCTSIENNPIDKVLIDDLFHSVQSFIAITQPNIVFVLEGIDNDPDLLFAFNMMPDMSQISGEKNF